MLSTLNLEQYELAELDQLVARYPLPDERSRLLLALAGAILIHLVILGFWQIDRSRIDLFPTLQVSLLPSVGKPDPVSEVAQDLILDKTTNAVPEIAVELVTKIRESRTLVPPLSLPAEKDELLMDRVIVAKKLIGFSLYNKAIEIVREGSLPQETHYKTFSTRDFPKVERKDPFESKEYIPVMVSEARSMEQKDQLGYYTIKRTNGFGKSVCYQQRGFAGDGNPPMWYRVPAASCGHIK